MKKTKTPHEQVVELVLDKLIEKRWYALASGVQVNILDIPKIFAYCHKAVKSGQPIDDAVRSAIEKYQLKGKL